MVASVRVVGPDLRRLNADLAKLAPTLRKELTKELRKAAEPVAADVRRAVLATPSKSGNAQLVGAYRARGRAKNTQAAGRAEKRVSRNGTGLRAGVARAVRVTVSPASGTVAIVVDRKQLRGVQLNLPNYLEGDKRPWRHPVYGHDRWVTQQAHPFFLNTIRRDRSRFNTAATTAMRTASRSAGFR